MAPRSTQYGRGLDVFDPLVRARLEGGQTIATNPGAHANWRIRPQFHSLVYGSAAGGTDVVSPEAKFAYPVEHGPDGIFVTPPAGSKFAAKAAPPNRRRRTSDELVLEVVRLEAEGKMPTAIADNVSDRRVRQILARAAA